jgi:hypothetical protein
VPLVAEVRAIGGHGVASEIEHLYKEYIVRLVDMPTGELRDNPRDQQRPCRFIITGFWLA